jgi:hypothetical protein
MDIFKIHILFWGVLSKVEGSGEAYEKIEDFETHFRIIN